MSQVRDVAYSTLTHAQRRRLHALLALRLTQELRSLDRKLKQSRQPNGRRRSAHSPHTPDSRPPHGQSPQLGKNQVLLRSPTTQVASARGTSVREMERHAFRRRMARRAILIQVIAQHWRLAGESKRAQTVQLLLRGDNTRGRLE